MAARILALFLAFLIPTLLLYPAMNFFAERATRELIATRVRRPGAEPRADAAALHRAGAPRGRRASKRCPISSASSVPEDPPPSDAAFLVWRQTALARQRLTSAVELYNRDGQARQPLSAEHPRIHRDAADLQSSAGCEWDVFGEVAPFGSEERRMLHAERRICTTDAARRAVAAGRRHPARRSSTTKRCPSSRRRIRTTRSSGPTGRARRRKAPPGGNVEVAIYGWGLQPIYTSGRSAWPITDALFARLYGSREPFWAEAAAGGVKHQVYFSNDRERIFAIGYPVLTLFDHFVHLAELTTLGGAAFLVVLVGTALFTRIARERPRVGRALLREIRASFYRKLFLAFVLAAIIPVLTLALVIRAYFANLLQADVEAEAARTAAVAQRVIEDLDTRPAPQRRDRRRRSTTT